MVSGCFEEICKSFIRSSRLRRLFLRNSDTVGGSGDENFC
jgi:hypothetical protein